MELLNKREVLGRNWLSLGRKSERVGPVSGFLFLDAARDAARAGNLEQPTCRRSRSNLKWVKVMKFFNGTGRAKESDGSRGTAILIDILIRTVASR